MKKGHKRKSHEHRKDLAGEYRWGDIGQLVFVCFFIIGMIIDIFVFHISSSWQEVVPWYYRVILFIPFFFTSGYFGQRSHKKVFEEERQTLELISSDVYARLRHPMYFGALLIYLCFVILSFSVVALVIFFVVVIFYYYLCRYEEQLLLEKLGEAYRTYMQNVPMLFPRVRNKQ